MQVGSFELESVEIYPGLNGDYHSRLQRWLLWSAREQRGMRVGCLMSPLELVGVPKNWNSRNVVDVQTEVVAKSMRIEAFARAGLEDFLHGPIAKHTQS